MFFAKGIPLQNSKITTVTMKRFRVKFKSMIFMYFFLKTFFTKTGKGSIALTIKASIICIKIYLHLREVFFCLQIGPSLTTVSKFKPSKMVNSSFSKVSSELFYRLRAARSLFVK